MNVVLSCSVQSVLPLIWVLERPSLVRHDFVREPFCEVALVLTVKNCSIYDAYVKMETFDMNPMTGMASSSVQEKRFGWFPLAGGPASGELLSSDSGVGLEEENSGGILSCGPYMWCNIRSTSIPTLRSGASAELPLHVVLFAPGTYDLSRYQISWSLLDHPLDNVKKEPLGKQNALGPPTQSKSTEATFASGLALVTDRTLGLSSSALSKSRSIRGTTTHGAGHGHPLLLTVMKGDL